MLEKISISKKEEPSMTINTQELSKKLLEVKAELAEAIKDNFRSSKAWRDLWYAGLLSEDRKKNIELNFSKALKLVPEFTVYICLNSDRLTNEEKTVLTSMSINKEAVIKAITEGNEVQLTAICNNSCTSTTSNNWSFTKLENAVEPRYQDVIAAFLITEASENEIQNPSLGTCQ